MGEVKLSCLETMLGDIPLVEKFRMVRDAGFDSIDLLGDQLGPVVEQARELSRQTGIEVTTIYSRLRVPLVVATAADRTASHELSGRRGRTQQIARLLAGLRAQGDTGYLGCECRGVFGLDDLRQSVRFVRALLQAADA